MTAAGERMPRTKTEHRSAAGVPAGRRGFRCRAVARAVAALLTAGASAMHGAGAADDAIAIAYAFAAPVLVERAGLTHVAVRDCVALNRIGEPALPYRTARVLLPPGTRAEALVVIADGEAHALDGTWRVARGRTPVSSRTAGDARPADPPDPAIYDSDAPYPAARAEFLSVQHLSGHAVALVRLFPVQYRPASGRLSFTPHLRLRVAIAAAAGRRDEATLAVTAPRRDRATAARVAAFVDNPELLDAPATAPGEEVRPAGSDPTEGYLLITTAALLPSFGLLLDRKAQYGLGVYTQTMETIAADWPGRDLAERVRGCIRHAYTNLGVRYVLLGGDIATVPCRTAYVPMPGVPDLESWDVPTDQYYACLDGSWNANGASDRWGEADDGDNGGDVDLLAEVYVGRAPVDTVAEADWFVEKTVRRETNAATATGAVLLAATYLGGAAQGGDMLDELLPLLGEHAVSRLDDRPYTASQWQWPDAIRELNRAPALVVYAGHGMSDEAMRMITDDLDAVTNRDHFLVYSVSCAAGAFDNGAILSDSIGEEFVKRGPHAAFAGIFNSRDGWFDADDATRYSGEYQSVFFDNLLGRRQVQLGAANQDSRERLLGQVESDGVMTYRWCHYEITLFGDPHAPFLLDAGDVTLAVSSACGDVSPAVGVHAYTYGSVVTGAVADTTVPGGAGERFVCDGWTGWGSVPANGDGAAVAFVIATNSGLAWNWSTQYWLSATSPTPAQGVVTASNGWHHAGADGIAVRAEPSAYYRFVRWEGDVPTGVESQAHITVSMDRPRELTARFAANVTSRGTPEWWLAAYGWTNDFEQADGSDTDADGAAAWREQVAGTCPTDTMSVLAIDLAPTGVHWRVGWPSVSNRLYSVYRADHRATNFLPVENGLVADPPRNTYIDTATNGTARFYRIGVTLAAP